MNLGTIFYDTLAKNQNLEISQEAIRGLNYSIIDNYEILAKHKPICKYNVAYIVGIVLIDDQDRICLVQEAKSSCRGKWYLPAGRMEKGEDLCMAAKRECAEETGYEIEPVSLCSIELSDNCWFRITFIAVITGGSLKKPEQADSESLQAQWFQIDKLRDKKHWNILRSTDFLKLMEIGSKYYKKYGFNSMSKMPLNNSKNFFMSLPNAYQREFNEYIFVFLNENASSYLVYVDEEQKDKLPSVVLLSFNGDCSIYNSLENITFPKCFENFQDIKYKLNGGLMVNYDGKPKPNEKIKIHDGLQMALLITILDRDEKLKEPFKWRSFDQNDLSSKIKENLDDDSAFIKVIIT
jgi:8-oxo-dGTP pyrophosphatase MutT (NUDIX family)